mmetsp:Transcript_10012/g.16155  ORF Transcript_10012/g.16155 Transcript_10012/m.16155 type:complete len:371 (-) Transcript_10012:79-1191(-)
MASSNSKGGGWFSWMSSSRTKSGGSNQDKKKLAAAQAAAKQKKKDGASHKSVSNGKGLPKDGSVSKPVMSRQSSSSKGGNCIFSELELEKLPFFQRKAEFLAELSSLHQKYEIALEKTETKKCAEIQLKLDTMNRIVADMQLCRQPPDAVFSDEYTLWMMDTLRQTLIPTGGYLTPNIFVPLSVWEQENMRMARYQLKINTCNQLLKNLIEIEAEILFNKKPGISMIKNLQKDMVSMRAALALQLAEVSATQEEVLERKSNTLGSFGMSIVKGTAHLRNMALPAKISVGESQTYTTLLVAIFEKAKYLAEMYQKGQEDKSNSDTSEEDPKKEMIPSLLLFLREVVCCFALTDLKKLILQHQEACERSFLE